MRYYRRNHWICILAVLLRLPVSAANVTLAWNPDGDPSVSGYNIYYGGVSGVYTKKISAGNTTNVTVAGLIPGAAYYFAASACSTNGLESPLSNEVSCRVPRTTSTANQSPTLDVIGDLTLNKNAGRQTVNFSGITSGATDENQFLTVRAVSSNPGLIPNPTVNYVCPQAGGSLTFTPVVNRTGTATITVTVKDSGAGNNKVTRKFTVTVAASTRSTIRRLPVIDRSLTNQTALVGQAASFAVKATGTGILKYQWKFNGTNLPATGTTLTLGNVTTNQSGVYSVTVTDWNGSTNSAARLTVYATAAGTLASAGLANGHYTLAVLTVPGCRYIVQASTDLVNWEPVETNIAPFTFEDAAADGFPQRFYRTVYAP
jgi:hypothetical protein